MVELDDGFFFEPESQFFASKETLDDDLTQKRNMTPYQLLQVAQLKQLAQRGSKSDFSLTLSALLLHFSFLTDPTMKPSNLKYETFLKK